MEMDTDDRATGNDKLSYIETEIKVVIKNAQVQALREDVQDRSLAITLSNITTHQPS